VFYSNEEGFITFDFYSKAKIKDVNIILRASETFLLELEENNKINSNLKFAVIFGEIFDFDDTKVIKSDKLFTINKVKKIKREKSFKLGFTLNEKTKRLLKEILEKPYSRFWTEFRVVVDGHNDVAEEELKSISTSVIELKKSTELLLESSVDIAHQIPMAKTKDVLMCFEEKNHEQKSEQPVAKFKDTLTYIEDEDQEQKNSDEIEKSISTLLSINFLTPGNYKIIGSRALLIKTEFDSVCGDWLTHRDKWVKCKHGFTIRFSRVCSCFRDHEPTKIYDISEIWQM